MGGNIVTPTYKEDKGIRLSVPKRYANKIMVVETSREYDVVRLCNMCNQAHKHKHYHLRIGSDASVIVSKKIFDELTSANQIGDTSGITIANGVTNPPAQVFGQRTHVRTEKTPKIRIKKVI